MRKSAYGVAGMLAGAMLGLVGFEANAVQTPSTQLGMRILFSFVPGACFLLATHAFLRFRLDETGHAAVRRQLDERAVDAARSGSADDSAAAATASAAARAADAARDRNLTRHHDP